MAGIIFLFLIQLRFAKSKSDMVTVLLREYENMRN